MLKDRSILITGVTGKAVLPIAAELAKDNRVFGMSRFEQPHEREAVSAIGVQPCRADFARADFDEVPRRVDYLLHFGWMRAPADRLDEAMKVNVEGAGLLLDHCRPARAALIISSSSVYRGRPDPMYRYREGDPIGVGQSVAAETSSICKIALESVARLAAHSLGIPMTIARLNTVLGPHRAFYGKQVDAVLAEREIVLPSEQNAHNPIHSEDMIRQIEPLLDAAGRAPLTVNWSGDEIIFSQDALARIEARTGRKAIVTVRSSPGLAGGSVTDTERRHSITGPCLVRFNDAFNQMLDEMIDGIPSKIHQRNWDYESKWQNRIFSGPK